MKMEYNLCHFNRLRLAIIRLECTELLVQPPTWKLLPRTSNVDEEAKTTQKESAKFGNLKLQRRVFV